MSSGRGTTAGMRFIPRVEALEDRTVPSGNVQVATVAGQLQITGDGAANRLWIAGAGDNTVVLRSLDGTTTINGLTNTLFVYSIKHGYTIDMGAGDDSLLVTGTRSRGALTVNMGDGNDVLGVSNAGHRGETTLRGGAGNDIILMSGSSFRSYVFADTGAGDDTVLTSGIRVTNFGLLNTAGSDFFTDLGSAIARPAVIGFAAGTRPAPAADTTAPTPTLAIGTRVTPNGPVPYTVTFDEPVGGFSTAGIAVTNASVTAFTQVDTRTYTFQLVPSGQGTVTVGVNAAAAVDAANNPSVASATVTALTPPSFTASNPPTVNFNAGAQTVSNFATFTPGLNGGTTPTYTVSNVTNTGLLSVQPAVAANGTLNYTPVAGGFGSSTFAVSASDGTYTTAAQTFTIRVDAVQGVSPTTIPGTTIDLSDPNWATIPTAVPAGNSAGIPAGTVADGTRILDTTVGTGATVVRGDQVTVAYMGYLLDGTVFDQSVSAQFTANEMSLIPGFAAGLIGMKVGGTRRIDISSHLAYGGTTRPMIPANSRLVFEVTVNSIP